MLQTYKSQSVDVEEGAPAHRDPFSADLVFKAIGFIRRQFGVVLSVLPLTIALACIYLFITPPLYKAETRIIIDTGKLQIFKQSIFDDPVTFAMMDSQIEVLKSDNFAISIIKKLGLTRDPEFAGSGGGLIQRVISLPLLSPLQRLFPSSILEFEFDDPTPRVLNVFERRLTVSRVGMSFVIEIAFLSTNPDRAAQIANAIADGFIVDQLEAKYRTIGQAAVWLQDRLNELRTQASAAERAVVEYKTKHNIVDTGGRLINEQQLAELNTALLKARADRVEAQARLDRISQIIDRGDFDPAATEVATVADAMRNEIISKLRMQYLDLAQREALFSKRLGHDHLAVVNIRNQMQEIRRSIFDELKRIAEASRSDNDIAKARENSLRESLAATVSGSQTTNKAQIELRELESAAQSYRMLYDNFQQRYTDSVQQQSFPVAEARVISRALPPSEKSSPKSFLVLMVATMGGLISGLGLAALREMSDRVFRTGDQVERQLNAECTAMVPIIKPRTKVASERVSATTEPTILRKTIPPGTGAALGHVIDMPLSPFAELIRAVKVSIDLNDVGKSKRVIGITSSVPNEGKSTIAASLAQLTAHAGARAILVDCDLRKPSLSQDLVPNATPGVIDIITDTASLDEVIWFDQTSSLAFLPAGVKSRGLIHTSEILASAAMKRLFLRLREKYDYVIVDLSPIIPVVDVRSTTRLVDSYVFVIEWGKTKKDVVERALNSAPGIYDKLSGVILNKVNLKRIGRYEGHSDYYNRGHYARYGYTD